MSGGDRITCQDCGDAVHVEVRWEHWGVSRLYYECQGCGRSGWTEPKPWIRPSREVSEP